MTTSGAFSMTLDTLTQIQQGAVLVTMAYDSAGRRTSLTLPNGVTTSYAYDAASRLTGLTYALGGSVLGTLTYTYDANGQRIATGGTWAATGLPQPMSAATYDAANRRVTFGDLTLTYDLNGNLTSDGSSTYTWNARSQLVAIVGGSVTATFSYDALGRRQRKTIDAIATDFLYDGLTPVQERDGPTLVATLLTGLGVDEYVTRTDSTGPRHFLVDALGSTVALTDDTGAVTTAFIYEPFRATTLDGAATNNAFDYTGREDDGTGLKYYRARCYSPALHRFLSEDLVSEIGVSRYAYVRNTPLNAIDPDGPSLGGKQERLMSHFMSPTIPAPSPFRCSRACSMACTPPVSSGTGRPTSSARSPTRPSTCT
jgi:RHS repeat-associated protein